MFSSFCFLLNCCEYFKLRFVLCVLLSSTVTSWITAFKKTPFTTYSILLVHIWVVVQQETQSLLVPSSCCPVQCFPACLCRDTDITQLIQSQPEDCSSASSPGRLHLLCFWLWRSRPSWSAPRVSPCRSSSWRRGAPFRTTALSARRHSWFKTILWEEHVQPPSARVLILKEH